MKDQVVKQIIKHIESGGILEDYNDAEAMDVISWDEVDFLKSSIREQDIMAFVINLAIMYVNQGLLYAKYKLSKDDFDDYMIWFDVSLDDNFKLDDDVYECQVVFSRKANVLMPDYLNPIDVTDLSIFDFVKDVNGLSDFYCYQMHYNQDCEKCVFIPKCLVDKYRTNLGMKGIL